MTTVEESTATHVPRIAWDQLVHATTALWRTQVVLIFTFGMPLVWLILIALLAGNEAVGADGVRIMQFAAPTAIAMGTFFATMPSVAISLAEAREKGILKRVRGTPLPAWCYFFGQVGAACLFAITSLVVTVLVSVLFYGVRLQADSLPATAVTVVVGILAFSALGLGISSLSASTAIAEAVSIGSAVALSFVSGLFLVGAELPVWLDRVASALPLKPYAVALQDQFNPYLESGWDLAGLAIIAAWGTVGAVVALRAFRWEAQRSHRSTHGAPADPVTMTVTRAVARPAPATITTRPSRLALFADQAMASLRVMWRRPGDVFFSLIMPIGLFALLVTTLGNGTFPDGQSVALATAASMVTWGAGVAAFMNLAESVARARDTRLLKRFRSTPLPAQSYLAGKAVAALALAIVLLLAILTLGFVAFGLRIGLTGLLLGALILLLGTACLAACGFLLAVLVPSARAVGAVGLFLIFVLSFFSDVFITTGPEWMDAVGSVFPLKHLQNGLATAWASDGGEIPWLNILILSGWTVVAGWLAVWRFRWEPSR